MTPDTQSMVSVALPTIAVLVGTLVNNSRLTDFRSSNDRRFDDVNTRFDDVNTRFDDVNRRFEDVNRRFDGVDRRIDEMRSEMRDLIRLTSERHDANLRRVEEVVDARLKHLEEREH
ncbi:MAG: hypothetical protein ACR2I2_23155 [Bryobacteraceae bacterium]